MVKTKEALEAALHALNTLHGLVVADGTNPEMAWETDNIAVIGLVIQAISELEQSETCL